MQSGDEEVMEKGKLRAAFLYASILSRIRDKRHRSAVIQDVGELIWFGRGIHDKKDRASLQDRKDRQNRFDRIVQIDGDAVAARDAVFNQGMRQLVGLLFDFLISQPALLTNQGGFVRTPLSAQFKKLFDLHLFSPQEAC